MPDSSKSFLEMLKEFIRKLLELIFSKVPKPESHEYVEMGDGLKWATCNIGASKPEEYGEYIAWGELEPYYSTLNPLTWKQGKETGYDFQTNRYIHKKYTVEDGKMVLEPLDDAARVRWGGSWRIPTGLEWEKLIDQKNFTWTYTNKEGVPGFTVTSKIKGYEGNQIFLPEAHCIIYFNWIEAPMGRYWSSSPLRVEDRFPGSDIYARAMFFEDGRVQVFQGGRGDGFCIRPVSD